MKTNAFLLALMVASSCVLAALGADAERKLELLPAYIETTNGLFSVCAFDRRDGVLLRYKDLSISRTNLPPVSIIRSVLIYAHGERPTRDAQTAASWNPRLEDMFSYGEIPYPVKDIDPPFELCETENGNVLIGVRFRSSFYAVTNAGRVAKSQLPNVTLYEAAGNRFHLVNATLPKHRQEEISMLVDALRAKQ